MYSTLKQAVGALTLHTGRNQYCKTTAVAIKKADGLVLAATLSPVSKMEYIAKVSRFFESAK